MSLPVESGLEAQAPKKEKKAPPWEMLQEAVNNGDAKQAEMAIKDGADVNQRITGVLPLHTAISGGHIDVAKILVANNSELVFLDEMGNSALAMAVMAEKNKSEMVRYFLSLQPEPETISHALHKAAAQQDTEPLEILLSEKVNVDAPHPHKSQKNRTPLMTAAANGRVAAVQVLLKNNAKKSLKDATGANALALARKAKAEADPKDRQKQEDFDTIIRLLGGPEAGALVGKVFKATGKELEITGESIGKLAKGMNIQIKNENGLAAAKVTEVMHSKVKARIISGKAEKGDTVHLHK